MEFEFDEQKSESNLAKHGISFLEARRLWHDPRHLVVPALTSTETRFAVIGLLENKTWTAILTMRDDRIRIISVRRTRHEERQIYNRS